MFTKTKTKNIWQSIKKFNNLMLVSFVMLLMSMLVSTNYANSQNLERTELNSQIKAAEDQLRLSNALVSELQTTERIENESKRLELVKTQTSDIYYLDTTQDLVALK